MTVWIADRMNAAPQAVKCKTALNAIALRYRGAIGSSYRTDWTRAFPLSREPAFDADVPNWRAFKSIGRSNQ
jgi:hypothetical protein